MNTYYHSQYEYYYCYHHSPFTHHSDYEHHVFPQDMLFWSGLLCAQLLCCFSHHSSRRWGFTRTSPSDECAVLKGKRLVSLWPLPCNNHLLVWKGGSLLESCRTQPSANQMRWAACFCFHLNFWKSTQGIYDWMDVSGKKYMNTPGNAFLCHSEPQKPFLLHTEPTISERLAGLKRLSTDPQALKKATEKKLRVATTQRQPSKVKINKHNPT